MPLYRVHFVDHGNAVYLTQDIQHDGDERAHQLNIASIGAGFEVWNGDRLVHRHRNEPS